MKKSFLLFAAFLGFVLLQAQDNPFAEYGYTPKIATLSQGQFNESFDNDTIVQIGSVLFNTKSKQIVAFVEYDTLYSEATLEPDIVSRWMSPDPLASKQPAWSPYKFGLDNPIIYIDPQGETEFYFKGKWIGTDGVENGLLAVVKTKDLKKSIISETKDGHNYKFPNPSHGTNTGDIFIIHNDVLSEAFSVMNRSKVRGGKREQWSAMNKSGSGFKSFATGEGEELSYQSDGFPSNTQGDVSIHSHLTDNFYRGDGAFADRADNASEGDVAKGDQFGLGKGMFRNYSMNIIVGKIGKQQFTETESGNLVPSFTRSFGISIWNNGNYDRERPTITINGGDAENMVSGERGKLGKKFDKKNGN